MFLRRGHLYVGLFMIPWVLVYAVSGFLLNHDSIWSGGTRHHIGPELVHGTGLDTLSPGEIAAEVTNALNIRAGRAAYQLQTPTDARFEMDFLPIDATFDGQSTRLNLDLKTQSGEYIIPDPPVDAATNPRAPFAVPEGIFGARKLEDQVRAGAETLFARAGVRPETSGLSYAPGVIFTINDDQGRAWKVHYDPNEGGVSGQLLSAAHGIGFKDLLFSLHFTAGYPSSANLRWIWAVFVDLTVGALIFWCVSGIFMWWQIKAVRRLGLVVLAASVVTAAVLGIAMHGLFSNV